MSSTPREIDPEKTFEGIVNWIKDTVESERAPGVVVGLSGTDSILTFLACAEAFNRLGKPQKVLGVHFVHKEHRPAPQDKIQCTADDFDWFAQKIIPWLKTKAPSAQIEIDDSLSESNDSLRWGKIFSRAVRDVDPRHNMTSEHFFPVGTRNATEQALGSYTQQSKSVSMLPIVDLFKTEVLEICQYLGVPQVAIDKSHEVDCDCGRYDTQAHHMRELDLYIMQRQGLLDPEYIKKNVSPDVLDEVIGFYVEETHNNKFRNRTPYVPEKNLVSVKR